MKVDERGATFFVMLPIEETKLTIEAMRKAEQAGNLALLQWSARRMTWLYDKFFGDLIASDEPYYTPAAFNAAWRRQLKADPMPESGGKL